MFCPECGKQIEDDSKFCEYCGNPVESDTEDKISSNSDEITSDFITNQKKAIDESQTIPKNDTTSKSSHSRKTQDSVSKTNSIWFSLIISIPLWLILGYILVKVLTR